MTVRSPLGRCFLATFWREGLWLVADEPTMFEGPLVFLQLALEGANMCRVRGKWGNQMQQSQEYISQRCCQPKFCCELSCFLPLIRQVAGQGAELNPGISRAFVSSLLSRVLNFSTLSTFLCCFFLHSSSFWDG